MTKNYRPINLFSIFSKIYEKFASNRLADKLAICGLFSDFQFGFRSSCSTTDILTVVSDRIIRVFIRDGANWAIAFDSSMDFGRGQSFAISDQVLGLMSSFLDNRRRVVLDGRPSQGFPVNVGISQGSILGPTLLLPYHNDHLDDVFYDIRTSIDDTFASMIELLISGNSYSWLLNFNLAYDIFTSRGGQWLA